MMNVVSATGLYKLPGRDDAQRHGPVHIADSGQGTDPMDDQFGDGHADRVRGLPAPRPAPARDGAGGGEGINTLINLSSRPARS